MKQESKRRSNIYSFRLSPEEVAQWKAVAQELGFRCAAKAVREVMKVATSVILGVDREAVEREIAIGRDRERLERLEARIKETKKRLKAEGVTVE